MRNTITLKLKPYLQEYITCKLGDPIVAGRTNIVGALLFPFVQTRPADVAPYFPEGAEYITLEIMDSFKCNISNGTAWISPENQQEFERILRIHFKEILHSYIEDKIRYSLIDNQGRIFRRNQIKKIILQFCSDLDLCFSEDMYEMMKKSFYRKGIETSKKSSGKLSLSCPLIFML